MNAEQLPLEHLTLRTLSPAVGASNGNVLILGNAYGVMPYQVPLAEAMAARGYRPSWFAFSGQQGTPGTYSARSCVRDIHLAVDHLCRGGRSLAVIAHCAGSIMALEALCQRPELPVTRMVVYGLLFDPSRRRAYAEPMLRLCGVNQAIEEDYWHYKWVDRLPAVRIPLLFCHAQDKINRERATEQEVAEAAAAAPAADVVWFGDGYDDSLTPLPAFARVYDSWLSHGCPLDSGEESDETLGH